MVACCHSNTTHFPAQEFCGRSALRKKVSFRAAMEKFDTKNSSKKRWNISPVNTEMTESEPTNITTRLTASWTGFDCLCKTDIYHCLCTFIVVSHILKFIYVLCGYFISAKHQNKTRDILSVESNLKVLLSLHLNSSSHISLKCLKPFGDVVWLFFLVLVIKYKLILIKEN